MHRSAALVLLSAVLPAQSQKPQLGPRSFFPAEYTAEYYVDVDALQDTDLWDTLERSVVAGPLFMKFKQEFGFRIRDLLKVRAASRFLEDDAAGEAGDREVWVTALTGNAKLCLPPPNEKGAYILRSKEKIAAVDVVREEPRVAAWPEARLYAVPRPGCLVIGSDAMIQSVLGGKRRGGVISSKLMALTASRRPLAYVAMALPQPGSSRYDKGMPFDTNWLSEDDPMQHLIARLLVDEKNEKTSLRMTMRFANGKEGPARLEEGMKAKIEGMKTERIYPMIKGFFEGIEWRRDGVDLHMSISLSRKKVADLFGVSGLLPWFLMASGDVAAAGPVPVAAPKPVKKVKAEKKAGKR